MNMFSCVYIWKCFRLLNTLRVASGCEVDWHFNSEFWQTIPV